ncbi:DUF4231 domain-containing protein [Streptomyces alboniger]|uniref:DUF4231 domain-containing protein n=1 Tax=Streptomyces alboniger TaxID=132473 RepID=UPI000AB335C7
MRVRLRRLGRRQPPAPETGHDALLAYAEEELAWYAGTRDRARRLHQLTELTALITGAATVVAAGIQAPAAVTASLAGAAVFIGGFRQVFQHVDRWVLAAESWTSLRVEVHRYRLLTDEDRDQSARERLLQKIEEVAATEVTAWASGRRAAGGGAAHQGQITP